jgi:hypothetical protein
MGLEPTTFCMASKIAGNDLRRHMTRKAAFLHGFRAIRGPGPASLHRPGFGRLGHWWATA